MRSYRALAAAFGAALAVTVLPSVAGAGQKDSGTWTYTDMTPNPTTFGSCTGPEVPSAPSDVNSYEIKVTKKKATLKTTAHNRLDWAGEVRDSKGNVIASVDSSDLTAQEHITVTLRKGTYTVHYCNWAGEPQITVDWSLK